MTLEFLQKVQRELEAQLNLIVSTPSDKPTIQHMNAIELLGATQLIKQLISQEHVLLSSPPGATGPTL